MKKLLLNVKIIGEPGHFEKEVEVSDEFTEKDLLEILDNWGKSRCSYCGEVTQDMGGVFDHIFTCEKRPEKQLMQKAFEVEDGLFKNIMHLTDHHYDPETCDTCREIKEKLDRYNEVPEHNQDVPKVR